MVEGRVANSFERYFQFHSTVRNCAVEFYKSLSLVYDPPEHFIIRSNSEVPEGQVPTGREE